MTAKVETLANELRGTGGRQDLQDRVEELTAAECEELDALVLHCAYCGWWCDAAECQLRDDEWVCDDCLAGAGA